MLKLLFSPYALKTSTEAIEGFARAGWGAQVSWVGSQMC